MTRSNTKLRAVFFAALMVLWVFAGAVAFGGSAAAQINSETVEDADDSWTSDTTRWTGQRLVFQDNDSGWSNFQIREFDRTASAGAQVGSLEGEFSVNDQRVRVINTDNLENDYVITAENNTDSSRYVLETDGDGEVIGREDASNDVRGYQVEFATQNLDAEFAEDNVNLGDSETLELSSNRDGYAVDITSDNLTQSALVDIFDHDGNDNTVETQGSDAVRVSGITGEDEISAQFNEDTVSEGDSLTFNVDAADTTASDTASISVGESVAEGASFDQPTFTEERGDIATISLTTQQVPSDGAINLTIYDEDTVVSNLEVSPNDDGEVIVDVNTFLITRNGETVSSIFEGQDGTTINTGNSTTNELASGRVIDAGTYDLIASESAFDDEPEEYALSTLRLNERATGEMTTYTAPGGAYSTIGDGDTETLEELNNDGAITESSEIAIAPDSRETNRRGDTIVHEVEVSGIYGALADTGQSSDGDAFDAELGNYLNLSIAQTNPGNNQDPDSIDFDTNNFTVVSDADNNTLYLITKSDNFDVEVGDEYQTQLNVTDTFQNEFLRSSNQVSTDESAQSTFELVDREAEFDTQNGQVRVPAAADSTISGETSVAPGTEMRVRARATSEQAEQTFLKTAEAVVQSDGTFEATFSGDDSFEDVESGTNFTASIRRQSFDSNAETDGQVGEAETASVSISDVEAEEGEEVDSITVDSAFLPQGGFVTIHDGSLNDGATFDSVRGTSDYLSEGDHEDVEVSLDEPYTEDGDAIAMPHQDTNGNEEYDFVDSEGEDDAAYENEDGDPVTDSASVSFASDPGTDTPTETDTPDETDSPDDDDGTDDQAGFGAVIALIALLGAALLAARRNAF